MADNTPSYSFSLPTVGGDSDLWGGFLNGNWTQLDALLDGTTPLNNVELTNATVHATELNADGGVLTDIETVNGTLEATKLTLLNSVCEGCLLYTSPSPRDRTRSRMPSSA